MGFLGGIAAKAGAGAASKAKATAGGGGGSGGGGLQAQRTRQYIQSLQQEIQLVTGRLKALRTDLREHQQLKRALSRK